MQQLTIGDNNVVEVQRLRNEVTGETVTDANVELTIYDRSGNPVAGQVWPEIMGHVADGLYRGTLDSTLELSQGGHYRGVVTAIDTGGRKKTWHIVFKAYHDKVM